MYKNAKALKKLRKAIRQMVGHLPVRELLTPTKVIMVPDYQAGLEITGLPKMVPFNFPLTATNAKFTQRGVYRQAKKMTA